MNLLLLIGGLVAIGLYVLVMGRHMANHYTRVPGSGWTSWDQTIGWPGGADWRGRPIVVKPPRQRRRQAVATAPTPALTKSQEPA
jgi:hypothetical protein